MNRLSLEETLEENEKSLVRDLAQAQTEKAVRTLAQIMGDKKTGAGTRVAAAKALLDYGWGKPTQQVTPRVAGSSGITVNIVRMGNDRANEVIDVKPIFDTAEQVENVVIPVEDE